MTLGDDEDGNPLVTQTSVNRSADAMVKRAVKKALPRASGEVRAAAEGLLAPWVERFVRLLDEAVTIPGTKISIGLDSVLGFLFPGAGDFLTGAGSVTLLLVALKERVPSVILLRMIINIGVDVLVGAVPILGDVFDVFWKSNRRNYDLIEEFRGDAAPAPSFADYAIVTFGVTLAILSALLPFMILALFGGVIWGAIEASLK